MNSATPSGLGGANTTGPSQIRLSYASLRPRRVPEVANRRSGMRSGARRYRGAHTQFPGEVFDNERLTGSREGVLRRRQGRDDSTPVKSGGRSAAGRY
jgi:hypothetical protein